MTNLDLKKIGVQELDAKEMVEVEGGFLPIAVIVGIWGVQAALCAAGISMYGSIKAAEISAE